MTEFNRKFGVEIEYTGIPRPTLRTLLIQNGYNCHPNDRGELNQWSVVYDGSVTDHNNTGGELVSPPLDGIEGIETVGKVAKLMVRNGAKADRSCGLHVHIDASDLSIDEIKTIVRRYARFESEIDAFMPRSRRGNTNNYCYSMTNHIIESVDRCTERNHFYDIERYYKVNVNAYQKHGTIEFRQHSGSINAEKIKNWVKFCISFVEESRKIHKEVAEAFTAAMNAAALVAQQPQSSNGIVITATPVASIMNNPNRPANYPINPVSEQDLQNVRIVHRETLGENYFRHLGYGELSGLSSRTIRYVLRYLINGFDIETNQIYTFSEGTVRRAMSALRQVGFKIDHRRGTGHYILNEIQPRSVFATEVQNILFNVGYVTWEVRDRQVREERDRERNRPRARYDVSLDDTLFRGMDEEVISYYTERATDFQETLATGRHR